MRTIPFVLAVMLAVAPAQAQTVPDTVATAGVPDLFPVGETLLYDARFGLLNLGEGLMHIAGVDTVRGTPTLHVVFRLQGGSFFYRLDDRMDSWIGLDRFASQRFVQDFHEGNSNRYTAYEIFPDSGYYTQTGVDSILPTSADPLDDAAFFYFVRTLDLEVGARYEFDRYFRPDRNPVVLEVLGRDTLDVPAGRIPTILVRPIVQGRGILEEAKEPQMWLSDDDRRIMVQLKLKFASIATITLRLREIHATPPKGFELRPLAEP
ncbi:MAG: DUF3108 domain-containing protein [Gemmatimonadales bacterium]|nr:DUF3108 domain-containing protein [Gemmatimonadales bacterium]